MPNLVPGLDFIEGPRDGCAHERGMQAARRAEWKLPGVPAANGSAAASTPQSQRPSAPVRELLHRCHAGRAGWDMVVSRYAG